jgi:pyruvate kinase
MARRTKIVATIGPASSDPEVLRAMIDAGMDMARVSLSHASLDDALVLIERIRAVAAETDQHVGILADLPGPKVRAAEFAEGEVRIVERSRVVLETAGPDDHSTAERIAIDHPGAGASLELGDRVVLGDGAIELVVVEVEGESAVAEVMTGGTTQGRPGVSVPTSRVALSSPTDDDLALLAVLCDAKVDMVAISFVRSAADIDRARVVSGDDGPMLLAKIETPEAVEAVEEIVATADAVMVARGDLGIRCAYEDVPHFQKKVIHAGVAFGRPVITATQMLESMVHSPVPTRAEVTDVTNAVFDGTSAVMLSGETAIGRHPVTVISTMSRIAKRADDEFDSYRWGRAIGQEQTNEAHGAPVAQRITAALSAATWRAAMDAQVDAIIACTETGATPRSISRFRPTAPLIAATPSERVARQLSTAWGITPMLVERRATSDDVVWFAIEAAVKHGYVRPGDLVAVLVGAPGDPEPASDTLRLVRVH